MKKAKVNKSQRLIYIIECKLDNHTKKTYLESLIKFKNKRLITNGKYRDLKQKIMSKWICFDSLSYSESYEDAIKKLVEITTINPWVKLRIVETTCKYNMDNGIAIQNYDYNIEKIHRTKFSHKLFSFILRRKYMKEERIEVMEELNSRVKDCIELCVLDKISIQKEG